MPIFMDRHDIGEASAEQVAEAHREDLKIQDKFNCRGLTYWFDPERGTAFCLIEAPSMEDVHQMHREAHGLIPNEVIEVNPSAVSAFLGRVSDPEPTSAAGPIKEPAFRAIMFTDMVGSTDITNLMGDQAAFQILQAHNGIIREALDEHGGREVDRAGDGFLTSFASAPNAVDCAVAIQQRFREYNDSGQWPVEIQVRIGLGAGEPVQHAGSLFGATVNLTARVCHFAKAEQILASHDFREHCPESDNLFTELGEVELKGFPEPITLDEIEWRGR